MVPQTHKPWGSGTSTALTSPALFGGVIHSQNQYFIQPWLTHLEIPEDLNITSFHLELHLELGKFVFVSGDAMLSLLNNWNKGGKQRTPCVLLVVN